MRRLKLSHKVVIELDFSDCSLIPSTGKRVLNCDVYDYLEELIEDGTLDYKVTAATGYTYGKIEAANHSRHDSWRTII